MTPLTPAMIDIMCTYHAPDERTGPKYAEIREAERQTRYAISQNVMLALGSKAARCNMINEAIKAFITVIFVTCPDTGPCIDSRDMAIRCALLAKNAANEGIMGDCGAEMGTIIVGELFKARWLACSAIATEMPLHILLEGS